MSPDILKELGSQYFVKIITKCEKIGGCKKSDVCITFDDDSQTTAQLKNGHGGGRGWSFDRRPINNIPTNEHVIELINNVCLKREGERKNIKMDNELIQKLLFGDDELTKPQHFLHTYIQNEKIISLPVAPAPLFIDTIIKNIYEIFNAKKTCVHLSPLIYLQRKGGSKTDKSPNDIQAKLSSMPDCMINIKLN